MSEKDIFKVLQQTKSSNFVKESIALIQNNTNPKIHLKGVVGSSFSLLATKLFQALNHTILLVLDEKEGAAYCLNELEDWFDKSTVLFFPSSSKRPYQIVEVDNANVVLRSETLNQLKNNRKPKLVVTYANALFEKVATRKSLKKNTLNIKVGEELSLDFLNEVLFSYQFNRVDFVSEPGEFSVRGGIVDIFSYANETPYRIAFFGDEIESIRSFDLETQLSIEKRKQIQILPNLDDKLSIENRESFFEFISEDTIVLSKNLNQTKQQIQDLFARAESTFETLSGEIKQKQPNELFLDATSLNAQIKQFTCLDVSMNAAFESCKTTEANQTPHPSFNKQFDLLIEHFNNQTKNGYQNYLICATDVQKKRFEDIFQDIDKEVNYIPIVGHLHEGFIDHSIKIGCYTDHQIFERYQKFNLRNTFTKKQSITLKELTALQIGDYVTHIDHGIGKFAGLKKIDNQGKKQEAIKLIYQNNDILYVSIHSLHKIAKYTGKDGLEPKVNKLGSPAWKNLKNKTKKKVKEVAFDLIKLYAKRKMQKGFAYSPDSYLQNELEASFIYEDTPDQLKATEDVKRDMENDKTMDRLICGDVGFGKTEIAIRAAFKAVTDGKQVAVLVPTTILAFQHYKTFTERLHEMPVRIEYLNRFKSAKQKRIILEDLEAGKVDIVIGTHQLASKNVKYKDLGLLIVDEEHKFGVSVKDKLKTLRENIDTLTLTATPIPRTLQFSLMAARDLSVIKTPPPNRQPVETKLIGFNEEQIRDAVFYEIQRGGQVYFIHNRVASLKEIAGMLQRLVPDAKIATGHGQMDGKQLEATMLDFMDGRYDILVSTTIVESGLDVPNANTILIHDAQNFGLADLHQMRGRVGRSNKKAFCYLVTPPLTSITKEARKRLQAVEQFSDLGSGFQIAMKDLEIRGAGNLLGAEQSGFITDIGFDTYQKILNEAIEELKEGEFKELFASEQTEKKKVECTIDTDLQILIPDHYVNSVEERLALYNELTNVKTKAELTTFEQNLTDRFGEPTKEVRNLLKSIELKWVCQDLGLERLVLKQGTMLGYFINNPQADFYQSETFSGILQFLQTNPKVATLKEKPSKEKDGVPSLMIRFNGVKSIEKSLQNLKLLGVENQMVES